MPVVWTDSHLVGQYTVTRLPNFLGWIDFLSSGAPLAWSSAIKPILNFRKDWLGRTSKLKFCKLFGFLSLLMIKKKKKRKMFFLLLMLIQVIQDQLC